MRKEEIYFFLLRNPEVAKRNRRRSNPGSSDETVRDNALVQGPSLLSLITLPFLSRSAASPGR